MLPIVIFDKNVVLPEGNCYIIAKGGVYLKKDTGLVSGIVKVENLSFLRELELRAQVKIPLISMELFIQIKNFFAAVYARYHSEAIVLLYFNEEKKEYLLSAPQQKVSAASLSYKPIIKENGFKLVGSVHSHANFGAFHSSIDHHDEANFDGLHITIGNVNRRDFSLSIEVVVNNNRFPQKIEDWVLGVVKKKNIRFIRQNLAKPEILSEAVKEVDEKFNFLYPLFKPEKRYIFVFPEDKTFRDYSFPAEWLKLVEKEVYVAYQPGDENFLSQIDEWLKESENFDELKKVIE